jgi:serine/threonine-protein kinase
VASRCVVEAFSCFCERLARDAEATWPHTPRPGLSREEDLLLNCTLLAQRALRARRTGHLRDMGSTVVAPTLGARGAAVAHVGDSRLYRLREGRLEALTRDHSVLEEMRAAGSQVPERRESPYGHIITRALGTENGVHDLGYADGAYYVRLDYVEGADLATLLARGRPGTPLALFVADELALALGAVHGLEDESGRPLGLVHRDVTPSNVLLSRLGEVKLADFGIAKATLLRDQTRAGVRKGTYAYMSPEQVRGGAVGPASDLFLLGITLHELLTGRRPFDGETPLETMDRIREAEVGPLTEVEESLRPVLRACLARRPEDRPVSAEALRQWLSPLRRTLPEAGPPELARWVREGLRAAQAPGPVAETVLEDT